MNASILRYRCFPVKIKIFVIVAGSVCVSAFYKKGPAAREAQRAASKKEMGFLVDQ